MHFEGFGVGIKSFLYLVSKIGAKPVTLDPLIWRTGCLLTCVLYGIASALEILNEGRHSKYQRREGS